MSFCVFSDCVCCGVCTDLDVCVSLTDPSDEMWRFSTSTHGWDLVDNSDGPAPRAWSWHVMTAVGLDLWVRGGVQNGGEGDVYGTRAVLLLLLC